jgi:hypothetical protein
LDISLNDCILSVDFPVERRSKAATQALC